MENLHGELRLEGRYPFQPYKTNFENQPRKQQFLTRLR